MAIKLICAIDRQGGIGFKNELLVKLPNDLKRFKELTTKGKFVLCGAKTFESIGHLPNREMIVASRSNTYKQVHNTNDLQGVLRGWWSYGLGETLWVCGGSEIYKQSLPFADEIYLTVIHNEFENVDAYFPKLDLNKWEVTELIHNEKDAKHPYKYDYITYKRKVSNSN
ncbi:dihydrofolate reductase [Streptomyces sp. NPDC057927]